jgi:RHS repeat-associated protein
MSALARITEINCDTRDANEDCINGGSRTRTKYAYDGNGNVSSRNGSIIGWTSYNYPDAVTTSTESATFDYGPDRQRWRMIYTGPSGTETTYYVSPQFEVVHTSSGTEYRHYISANGRPVMVIGRTTTDATNFRSLLLDHQGSISTIVNANNATSYATESFTAYGNRREASSWIGAPTSGELTTMNGVTREGYTFQTVLGSMGLNHMNGRIEDAVTGRFLSPDPRGTILGNTQSWNRYSYVINNPLTMSDPSGFDTFCDDSGCTVTGGGGGGAPAPGDFVPSFGPPDLVTPTVDVPPVPPPVIIAPDIPEVVVTAPKPTPITAAPFDFPSPTVQLADLPVPAPLNIQAQSQTPKPTSTGCPNGGTPSAANNPKAGRNIMAGMVGGAGIFGFFYTAIAVLNLEDGGGEVMLALRAAQLARNGESVMFASDSLEAVASASGTVDAAIAAANGGGIGVGVGAAGGALMTGSVCPGRK